MTLLPPMTAPGRVRRAGPEDAAALAMLRAEMYRSWLGGIDPSWLARWESFFAGRLPEVDRFAGFVVEEDGLVVAGGTGHLEQRLPGPHNATGVVGHVANMCTLPQARQRGYGRLVLTAIVEWFREQGVPRADLKATDMGAPLYQSLGFKAPANAVYLQLDLGQDSSVG